MKRQTIREVKKVSGKKKAASRLVNFIVAISLGVCILLGASSITYALFSQIEPDVFVRIDNDGNVIQSGDFYADTKWHPGFCKSGIMRLQNNFRKINVSDLGLNVDINDIDKDNPIYDSFVKNMILTISKGNRAVFNTVLIEKKSLFDLMAGNNAPDASSELDDIRFTIEKGETIDLKYDLLMDWDSGNELMNLTAQVTFCMRFDEIADPKPKPDDDDDDDDDDRDDKGKKLIEEPANIFPSIDGHWAHDCILALIQNDILDPDSIRPDDYITRAEAAVLLGRALRLEESDKEDSGYIDAVPTWAKGYIIATSEAKVFKGYPGRIFKANANISREEMTAVLIRAFREDASSDAPLSFVDSGQIADWARGNVAKSVEDNIVTGYPDNTFRSKAYMTRAEAFTIVCKLLGYHELHNKEL